MAVPPLPSTSMSNTRPPNENDPDLLWTPSSASTSQTSIFLHHINSAYSLSLNTYQDLHAWSCAHRSDFWSEVWDFHSVIGTKGSGPYVDESLPPSANPPWFPRASLNWAENQLRNAKTHPDDIAIIEISETCEAYTAEPKCVSQRELYELVARAQGGLRKAGVQRGDRVAFWGGNCLEAAVVLLATSACGAIFSSAASDFGVDGVKERLLQIKPKVLFVTNAVVYNSAPRVLPVKSLLATLDEPPEKIVMIDHLPPSLAGPVDGCSAWEAFCQNDTKEVEYEKTGFNEPVWILFSSGTTGKPKAIVVSPSTFVSLTPFTVSTDKEACSSICSGRTTSRVISREATSTCTIPHRELSC